jgi:hypothetical protein
MRHLREGENMGEGMEYILKTLLTVSSQKRGLGFLIKKSVSNDRIIRQSKCLVLPQKRGGCYCKEGGCYRKKG